MRARERPAVVLGYVVDDKGEVGVGERGGGCEQRAVNLGEHGCTLSDDFREGVGGGCEDVELNWGCYLDGARVEGGLGSVPCCFLFCLARGLCSRGRSLKM